MSKTTVIYVKFLPDVACQKLFNSANVLRSYSQKSLAVRQLYYYYDDIRANTASLFEVFQCLSFSELS